MLKNSIPNVSTRPCCANAESLIILGDEAAQNLSLLDDQGGAWRVVYLPARQPDGSWAVDDYLMVKFDGEDPS
jgi:hypothetical protein